MPEVATVASPSMSKRTVGPSASNGDSSFELSLTVSPWARRSDEAGETASKVVLLAISVERLV